jgi:UDP-N-acetylmuramoyl-L-alanyl-D-glutamate--2,6-diaminopimelate ligase
MMTLQQLLPEMPLSELHGRREIRGLRLDSRRVVEGDLFVALSGGRQDGRRFIEAAILAGAMAVLIEAEQFSEAEQGGVPVIGVPALSATLAWLATRFHRNPVKSLTVFGITGTNGKSSVAWFLRDALNALGMPCGLIGTLGAHFADYHNDLGHTTPDTLTLHESLAAFRDRGARFVAMEVSSHALAQDRLAGVPVSVAGFTNLSRDHLDYHGDMESYFVAKQRLFNSHAISAAVINTADAFGARLADSLPANIRCVRVGDGQADIRCLETRLDSNGMQVRIAIGADTMALQSPLYGRFNIDNLMIVAGMLAMQGVDVRANERALAAVTPVPGRMQPVRDGNGPTVLVDYAHTPDGLEKALHASREHFRGRLWCVVGCGGNRDAGKRPQMAAVAERLADHLVFTSDNPRHEEPQAIVQDMLAGVSRPDAVMVMIDRAAAVRHAVLQASADDVVLIAGKGHERWQEIGDRKLPLDDLQLARAALRERNGGEQ